MINLRSALPSPNNNSHLAAHAYRHSLLPGDRLIESIFQTGFSKHHSIYLGVDQYGIEWISENHKFDGVRLVQANDFFQDNKLYKVEKFKGNYLARIRAVRRALTLLGKPYDLINFNCEHYASHVQTGKAYSRQVFNIIAFFCICLLIILYKDGGKS